MNDETIVLILDLARSSKDVSELTEKLTSLRKASNDVGDSYQLIDKATATYAVSTDQADRALDAATASAVEHTRAQKALNIVLEETAAAQAKASGTTRDMQMRILNLGRAAQDLAQGGFGGIINNIEGIVGGGGIAAGVLTAIGTAALLATPYIKAWVKSLGEGGEKFAPITTALEKLTDSINRNKKEMGELKEKNELTFIELLRYKELLAETTRLEDEQATKRAARQVVAGSSKKEQARAAAVRETIAEEFGSGDALIDSIMETDAGKQVGVKKVEEYLAGAQKGFGSDIQSLGNLFPKFKEKYTPYSPERQAEVKQAQDNFKKEQDALGEREKRAKEKEQTKKEADAEAVRKQAQMDEKTQRGKDVEARTNEQNDSKFRQNLPKLKQEIRDTKEAQQVQREQAAMGNDVNFQQAFQFVKQRQAEMKRLQGETLQTVIGNQDEMSQEINQMRTQLRQARQINQKNRSAMSNGFN